MDVDAGLNAVATTTVVDSALSGSDAVAPANVFGLVLENQTNAGDVPRVRGLGQENPRSKDATGDEQRGVATLQDSHARQPSVGRSHVLQRFEPRAICDDPGAPCNRRESQEPDEQHEATDEGAAQPHTANHGRHRGRQTRVSGAVSRSGSGLASALALGGQHGR